MGALSKLARTIVGDLPMDEASRMARAREMGFDTDTTWYHGTSGDFDQFKRRRDDIGIHLGTADQANERIAYKVYRGSPETPSVMPVLARMRNPLRLDDLGAWDRDNMVWALERLPEFGPEARRAKTLTQARDMMERRGYDGIIYRNTGETPGLMPFIEEETRRTKALREAYPDYRGSATPELQQTPEYRAMKEAHERRWAFMEDPANTQDSIAVFRPNQIRSRFARFDPRNAESGSLLASGAGIAALAADDETRGALARLGDSE
jgi:hypothetical protein